MKTLYYMRDELTLHSPQDVKSNRKRNRKTNKMKMKDELRAILSELDRLGVRMARLIDNGLDVNNIINATKDVLGFKLPLVPAFRLIYFIKEIWGKK